MFEAKYTALYLYLFYLSRANLFIGRAGATGVAGVAMATPIIPGHALTPPSPRPGHASTTLKKNFWQPQKNFHGAGPAYRIYLP